MKSLWRLLLVALGPFVAVMVSTSLFLAVGSAVSAVLPLSLFQAALLAVGASFVVVFGIAAVAVCWEISRYVEQFVSEETEDEFDEDDEEDFDEDDEDDDYDEDPDDFEDAIDKEPVFARSEKPPRNARCSCGSGLKYKHCCGK